MVNYYPPNVTVPVYAVFMGMAVILTGLRFWARIGYTKARLGVDDWLMLAAIIVVCCCSGIQFYNALEGTGGAAVTSDDDKARAIASKKVDFTMVVIEKPAFGFIKLSLLFFYKRIFGIWPSFKRVNLILIWVVILWTISFMVADLSICGTKLGYEFMLDQSHAADHCADNGLLLLLFAVTSVLTDMLVLGLPFVYINRLQMPPQKKWATGLVFLLGFVSTGAGVLRTIFLCISYPMGRMSWNYKPPPDEKTPLVLEVFNPTFFVMIEMYLGAWAANLPPLGPILGALGFREMVASVYRRASMAYASAASAASGRRQSTAYASGRRPSAPFYPTANINLAEKKSQPSSTERSATEHQSSEEYLVSPFNLHPFDPHNA